MKQSIVDFISFHWSDLCITHLTEHAYGWGNTAIVNHLRCFQYINRSLWKIQQRSRATPNRKLTIGKYIFRKIVAVASRISRLSHSYACEKGGCRDKRRFPDSRKVMKNWGSKGMRVHNIAVEQGTPLSAKRKTIWLRDKRNTGVALRLVEREWAPTSADPLVSIARSQCSVKHYFETFFINKRTSTPLGRKN